MGTRAELQGALCCTRGQARTFSWLLRLGVYICGGSNITGSDREKDGKIKGKRV